MPFLQKIYVKAVNNNSRPTGAVLLSEAKRTPCQLTNWQKNIIYYSPANLLLRFQLRGWQSGLMRQPAKPANSNRGFEQYSVLLWNENNFCWQWRAVIRKDARVQISSPASIFKFVPFRVFSV